jgi:hypothetical protein
LAADKLTLLNKAELAGSSALCHGRRGSASLLEIAVLPIAQTFRANWRRTKLPNSQALQKACRPFASLQRLRTLPQTRRIVTKQRTIHCEAITQSVEVPNKATQSQIDCVKRTRCLNGKWLVLRAN